MDAFGQSPHDYLDDGLDIEPDPVELTVIERCGCEVVAGPDIHDVGDCLEAQADAAAAEADERRHDDECMECAVGRGFCLVSMRLREQRRGRR